MSSEGLRRVVLAGAAAACAWAVAVGVTGGFVLQAPWGRISSRDLWRPLAVGAALLLLYVARWRHRWVDDVRLLAGLRWPPMAGAAAAAFALVLGVTLRSTVAAGPDASGYVSQAALIARGELTIPVPQWALRAPWPRAQETAAPSGYVPTKDGARLAPNYQPGLPLLMALAQILGGPSAVYFVVPLLAAVAAWATYRLGQLLAGPWAGAIASALLVSSPAFLVMLVQAMSDVPVTAFWTVALVAAVRGRAWSAGAATAAAVLIRPNLVPMAGIPALLLVAADRGNLRQLVAFAVAAVPAPLLIAGLNDHHFGSPLRSGYGSLEELYSPVNVVPNLLQYGRWLVTAHGPLILLAALAPLVKSIYLLPQPQVWLIVAATPATVLVLYLPYWVFQPDEWSYLRFLLPAFPAVLAAFAAVTIAAWRRRRSTPVRAVVLFCILFTAYQGWTFALHHSVFGRRRSDERYAQAAEFVRGLPGNAVIASDIHSGPIRFYTGRDVLRFERFDPDTFQTALAYLEAARHTVYLVGEPSEIERFRNRFSGTAIANSLTASRCADLREVVACRIVPR